MTPAEISTAPNWSFRADEAARSVTRLFGQRLFFLPGTHIAAVVRPSGRVKNLARPWHYWWQAHYVDCLVDTGRRELGTEGRPGTRFDGENRPSAGRLASRLVTGIRLRNFLTFVNNYYDDMAWLALSTLRLEKLAEDSRKAAGTPPQRQGPAEPHPAVRFRLHGRPGRRHLLEQEAGLQEHPGHGTRGALLRPHRQGSQGAGPAGLAGCPAFRPRTGHVPGRTADRSGRRRGAGERHLHLQPGAGPRRAAGTRRRHQPGPRFRARGRRGPQPHPPGAADGAQRHGAALRGDRRRRAVHRHPRPVPGPGRRRRTASAPRSGARPRHW